MDIRVILKGLLVAAPLFLAACASSNAPQENPGVQDITPGQESIIQSPEPANSGQSTLEERPL